MIAEWHVWLIGENVTAELVQTKLGTHLENRVNSFLSDNEAADVKITVRVLACTTRSTELKPFMRRRFPDAPGSFAYTAKGIFAFQKIDGKDICFFGLHTQEYGSDVPLPNNRLIVLRLWVINSGIIFDLNAAYKISSHISERGKIGPATIED